MGANFSKRKLSVKDVAVHAYGDTAWAEFHWDFAAKLRNDGTPLATHGRETQLYRKIDGRWRLVCGLDAPVPRRLWRRSGDCWMANGPARVTCPELLSRRSARR
jgi:hypothetical protein